MAAITLAACSSLYRQKQYLVQKKSITSSTTKVEILTTKVEIKLSTDLTN